MSEPQVTHEVIETPFQIAMDCQHVAEQADHICWNCTIKIIDLAEAAEARAAELDLQRDRAAYEATMTAARVVYDLAVKSKIDGRIDDYSAQIMAFNAICLSSGIR